MKHILHIIIGMCLLAACSYDEQLDLCQLTVTLVYP